MLKKLRLQLFITLSFLLLAFAGTAQTFPVTISTQLTQPSPIYLSNYADATTINSPIKVQLILNDLTISNRQVRLKCYFQGNGISFLTNDFVVGARPLHLEGGFPLQLTNIDLAPYFQFQNIQGINPNQYAQALPEGIYSFSVEVYDFATGKKLSRKTSVTTIIFQNDPPFLNLPLNNASIMQQNIQNIIFSWTPRQINVSNVEYEFALVEIWDKYTPVQNAFAYSPPLYTTTTRTTTLQYSLSEPQLIPGRRYAWRIKAKALANAEEVGVFKNNGYSEIYSFTYEVFCTAPLAIETTSISQDQAKITWSGDIANYDYQVNYREKNASSEWYKLVTPREYATISNLKPNTTYEYTVGASCDLGKYTHSNIKEFTTMASDEIAFVGCGIKPDPNDLANKTPLPDLFPNDVVTAGDFPIVVLHSTGSNGTFSGDGYVTLPFLEKFRKLIDAADALGGEKTNIGKFSRIRITFNNIGVNTDFKLISGEIIASYDPTWSGVGDLDPLINDVFGDIGNIVQKDIQFVIDKVVKNPDGTITVTGPDGVSFIEPKTANDIIFTDKDGKQYAVPPNAPPGDIAQTGQLAPGGIPTSKNTNGMGSGGDVAQISSEDVTILFSKGNGFYAFDVAPATDNGNLSKTYETIPQKNGNPYKVSYKAISDSPNSTDIVTATATFKNGKTKDDIVFKTQTGTEIKSTWSGNTATIDVKRTLDFAKETIIATVKPTASKDPKDPKAIAGNYDIAGTMNMWHLSQKNINLKVISINNASITNVENDLNAIYNKAGVKFNVSTQNVNLPSSYYPKNTIECGDSGWLAQYTAEQQAIIAYIKTQITYEKDSYYVLVTNIPSSKGLAGFMPLKRQFGFIFSKATDKEEDKGSTTKTIAHELGHGVFGLQHPFTEYKTTSPTDLLMDYGTGTEFSHNDWQVLHAPGLQLYLFQGDEAGENIVTSIEIPNDFLNLDKKTLSFITSQGQIVSIPKDKLIKYEFTYGSVTGDRNNPKDNTYNNNTKTGSLERFTLKIDEKTSLEYIIDSNKGYVNKNGEVYKDLTDFSKVNGFIYPLINENSNYAIFKLSLNPTIEHETLSQYKSGATNDLSLIDFINKISPYSTKFLVPLNKELKANVSVCSWCYNKDTQEMLKTHFGKPEQLWVNKIAEMRVVYPKFFERFTDTYYTQPTSSIYSPIGNTITYKWDENFRTESSNPEGWRGNIKKYDFINVRFNDNNKSKYFEKYFQYFDTSLNEQIKLNNECLKTLFDTKITSINEEQIACLKLATELEFQKLESNKALELVQILLKRNLWSNEEEKIIVDIIKYAKFDSDVLISLLETHNQKMEITSTVSTPMGLSPGPLVEKDFPLWYVFFEKINDSNFLFSGNNRKELMKVFYQYYLKSNRFKNDYKAINDKYATLSINDLSVKDSKFKIIEHDYQNIFRRGWSDMKNSFSNDLVIGMFYEYDENSDKFNSVTTSYDAKSRGITIEQNIKRGLFNNKIKSKSTNLPFDLILFKNYSEQDLLGDFKAYKDKNHITELPVPAIIIHYASEVGREQTQSDIIQTSVDVITLAIPGGQFTTLGRALFYADKISSISSMAGTAFRETNPELATFFNRASLATGVLSVTDLAMPNKWTKISALPIEDALRTGALTETLVQVEKNSLDFAKYINEEFPAREFNQLSKDTKEAIIITINKDIEYLKVTGKIENIAILNKAIGKLKLEKVIENTVTFPANFPVNLKSKLIAWKDDKLVNEFILLYKDEKILNQFNTNLELADLWKKWGIKGVKNIDELSTISRIEKLNRGTFEAFETTVGSANMNQKVEAYKLWGDKDWDGLYNFFHADPKNLINGGWPPYSGFVKIERELGPSEIIANGGLFDRFQNPRVDKADGKVTEVIELGGGFASPVKLDEYNKIDIPFTYDSRALLEDIQEGMVYIKFRIKKADGLKFRYGDAIPWKNKNGISQQGLAKQVESSTMKFHDEAFINGIHYDIVQRSVFRGGRWVDDIEDLTFRVDKLIKNIDCK